MTISFISKRGIDMATERELALDLFEACRSLLRYNGIDPDRTARAMNDIRDITGEWMYLDENDELDDE